MSKEKVLKALKDAGRALRPGDIAQITGLDKNSVSKLIKELKNEGEIYSPKRCFYAPGKKGKE